MVSSLPVHRVEIERADGVVVIAAGGELDAFAEPDLSRAFADVADEERVVVDLAAVSFLDSTALGAIVRALRELDDRGGRARLVLPRASARRIFEITTLDRTLPTVPNRAQALAELTPQA